MAGPTVRAVPRSVSRDTPRRAGAHPKDSRAVGPTGSSRSASTFEEISTLTVSMRAYSQQNICQVSHATPQTLAALRRPRATRNGSAKPQERSHASTRAAGLVAASRSSGRGVSFSRWGPLSSVDLRIAITTRFCARM